MPGDRLRKRLLVYVLMHEQYGVVAADYCPARLDRLARRMPDSLGQLSVFRLSGLATQLDGTDPLELCPMCGEDCRDGLVKGFRDE